MSKAGFVSEINSGKDIVTQLSVILSENQNDQVLIKAAMVVAVLAKTDVGRALCCSSTITSPLLQLLSSPSTDTKVLIQVCRALGNICYENSKYHCNIIVIFTSSNV